MSVHANDVNTWRRSTPHAPLHQSVSHLGEPLGNAVIQAHILTGDDYMRKLGNEHTDVVCDTVPVPFKLWRNRHIRPIRQRFVLK